MPRPTLAMILVGAIVLIPSAFVLSRRAAGAESAPVPPLRQAAPPAAAGAGAAKAGPPAEPARQRPSTGSRRPPAKKARKKATKGDRLAAAVRRHQTAVLMLSDGRGADDRATARAVRGLKGRAPGTRVFVDSLRHLGAYQAVIGGLGVSQSPSVVIVGRGGAARVVEGYVDPETLLQQVLDARR